MRIIVCGGRAYQNRERVFETLDALHRERRIELVAQGGAEGADALAKQWARDMGVETGTFYADWKAYGRLAGPMRNQRMLVDARPDLVVAFPGGRGTADMILRAEQACVPVRRIP
jgi:hypothetical protein